ncbi:MAG: hypothetical protein Q7O66_01115 [Dehalococcoidia bacterium]|nr:hypothetical protein [Dehalococcoidia bacterium]
MSKRMTETAGYYQVDGEAVSGPTTTTVWPWTLAKVTETLIAQEQTDSCVDCPIRPECNYLAGSVCDDFVALLRRLGVEVEGWRKEPDFVVGPSGGRTEAEQVRVEAREALALLWQTLQDQPGIDRWLELCDAKEVLKRAIGGEKMRSIQDGEHWWPDPLPEDFGERDDVPVPAWMDALEAKKEIERLREKTLAQANHLKAVNNAAHGTKEQNWHLKRQLSIAKAMVKELNGTLPAYVAARYPTEEERAGHHQRMRKQEAKIEELKQDNERLTAVLAMEHRQAEKYRKLWQAKAKLEQAERENTALRQEISGHHGVMHPMELGKWVSQKDWDEARAKLEQAEARTTHWFQNWQEAQAKLELAIAEAAALLEALKGANWIIGKLAAHEAIAIAVRGYVVSPEDQATGTKYRAMIDKALGLEEENDLSK